MKNKTDEEELKRLILTWPTKNLDALWMIFRPHYLKRFANDPVRMEFARKMDEKYPDITHREK